MALAIMEEDFKFRCCNPPRRDAVKTAPGCGTAELLLLLLFEFECVLMLLRVVELGLEVGKDMATAIDDLDGVWLWLYTPASLLRGVGVC